MKDESNEVLQVRLLALSELLEKLQPVLKAFMTAKNKQPSGWHEKLMAFAILERIYYNTQGCIPSAIELRYNHHAALPLSHIFRAIYQEILIAYWLFSGDYYNKVASLNSEFIVRNDKRSRSSNPPPNEEDMQGMYHNWLNIAPDNFELLDKGDNVGELRIKKEIKFTSVTAIAENVISQSDDLAMLYRGYNILSQQAHLSEFSREIIYNRYNDVL